MPDGDAPPGLDPAGTDQPHVDASRGQDLQSGEGAATVLTTDIGRIIDRPIIYASSDAVYLLAGEGHADGLARYFCATSFQRRRSLERH